jgi:hypothetical protein
MARFRDIPPYTRWGNYACDVGLGYFLQWMKNETESDPGLNVDPDFQRGHVWSVQQQIAYIEHLLREGKSGRDILCNCPGYQGDGKIAGPYVLVDGKQRVTAALRFLNNEIPAFGYLYNQYTDRLGLNGVGFKWHINNLQTRAEVLQWYLDLNAGGVVHTDEEIKRVRLLLEAEKNGPPNVTCGSVLHVLQQSGLVPSFSEARRHIAQGAVLIDECRVGDTRLMVAPGLKTIVLGKKTLLINVIPEGD